jgi:methylglutaconyl-CoA hydratase
MSVELVVREDQGPVVVLVLNQPKRRNPLSRALIAQLGDHLTAVAAEPAVRSVVITGAGTNFCAGMDLKEAELSARDAEAEKMAIADLRSVADLIDQIHELVKPTVAALNGDALAGGAGIALACDFVIAAESAKIGYPEVKRGLVAAMVMHDLVRQVGERRARSLLLTGEPIGAIEAERWGLVNHVVPLAECRAKALEVARSLLACGPLALAATKRLVDEATARPSDLRGAAAVTAAVRVSDEALEGMRAFLEKRPPRWSIGTS